MEGNFNFGGSLIWEDYEIVVIDSNCNLGLVHRQTFAKGAEFTNQRLAKLAQHAIDCFDASSRSFAFGVKPVLPAR